MRDTIASIIVVRRVVLRGLAWAAAGLVGSATVGRAATEDDADLIARLVGPAAVPSSRLRLQMPPVFGNGYTVPLVLDVDSPMTPADHVRSVHILAPKNPIVPVADFHFTPSSGRAHVSTRIRLAAPQYVVALAEMSDGMVLTARTWVSVDTNGCE